MTDEARARELAAKLLDNVEASIDLAGGTCETRIRDSETLILAAFRAVERETLREAAMIAHRMPPKTLWFSSSLELDAYCAGRHDASDAIRALIDAGEEQHE